LRSIGCILFFLIVCNIYKGQQKDSGDITDTAGKMSSSDGYFTGIAEQTALGWQLLNAHWSMIPAK